MKASTRSMSRMELLGLINSNVSSRTGSITFKIFGRKPGQVAETSFKAIDAILVPVLDEKGEVVYGPDQKPQLEEATICWVEGQSSIFMDEIMARQNWTEEDVKKRIKTISTWGDEFVVPSTSVSQLAFMRSCNWNTDMAYRKPSSKRIFEEYNPAKRKAERVKQKRQRYKVINRVENLIDNDQNGVLYAVAGVLMNMPIDAVKRSYAVEMIQDMVFNVAENEPEKINRIFTDKRARRKMYLLEAIHRNIVRVNSGDFNSSISMGDRVIFTAQPGADVMEAAAEGISELDMSEIQSKVGPMIEEDQKREDAKVRLIKDLQKKLDAAETVTRFISNATEADINAIAASKRTPEFISDLLEELIEDGVIDKVAGAYLKHPALPVKKLGEDRKSMTLEEAVKVFMDDAVAFVNFLNAIQSKKEE